MFIFQWEVYVYNSAFICITNILIDLDMHKNMSLFIHAKVEILLLCNIIWLVLLISGQLKLSLFYLLLDSCIPNILIDLDMHKNMSLFIHAKVEILLLCNIIWLVLLISGQLKLSIFYFLVDSCTSPFSAPFQ